MESERSPMNRAKTQFITRAALKAIVLYNIFVSFQFKGRVKSEWVKLLGAELDSSAISVNRLCAKLRLLSGRL